MNTSKRLIQMILRGNPDKFKTVLQEELQGRVLSLIEQIYHSETKQIFNAERCIPNNIKQPETEPLTETPKFKFIPESSYQLKDGNIGILTSEERVLISKLYESLNNTNRERMVKLLSESQNSFNQIRKLAKQNKQ